MDGYKKMKHTAHQFMYMHTRAAVYTNTMFSKVKSLQQHTCAQVSVTTLHWTKVYPMRLKSMAHLTLAQLYTDIGVFNTIIADNVLELTSDTSEEFKKTATHAGAVLQPVVAYTQNQN
jgi:hypothetical protein